MVRKSYVKGTSFVGVNLFRSEGGVRKDVKESVTCPNQGTLSTLLSHTHTRTRTRTDRHTHTHLPVHAQPHAHPHAHTHAYTHTLSLSRTHARAGMSLFACMWM